MNFKETLKAEPVRRIDLSFYVEVRKGTPVADAVEKMQASHRKCALVLEGDQLEGIFTAHDIRDLARESDALQQSIDSVMTRNPETISGDASLFEAIQVLNDKPYRYLPVLNKDGHVIGTLTHFAVLKHISDHFPEDIYNLPPEPNRFAQSRDGA